MFESVGSLVGGEVCVLFNSRVYGLYTFCVFELVSPFIMCDPGRESGLRLLGGTACVVCEAPPILEVDAFLLDWGGVCSLR